MLTRLIFPEVCHSLLLQESSAKQTDWTHLQLFDCNSEGGIHDSDGLQQRLALVLWHPGRWNSALVRDLLREENPPGLFIRMLRVSLMDIWPHNLSFVKTTEVKWKSLSCTRFFATLWTVAHQAPPSMEFSRQEYWSGLPCPPPAHLPDPGTEPMPPTLQADSLPPELPGKPKTTGLCLNAGIFQTKH